jgi:iron complex transport system substrate-binding protein
VKKGRAVVLPAAYLGCVSHLRIDAYEALAKALHPEAMR